MIWILLRGLPLRQEVANVRLLLVTQTIWVPRISNKRELQTVLGLKMRTTRTSKP